MNQKIVFAIVFGVAMFASITAVALTQSDNDAVMIQKALQDADEIRYEFDNESGFEDFEFEDFGHDAAIGRTVEWVEIPEEVEEMEGETQEGSEFETSEPAAFQVDTSSQDLISDAIGSVAAVEAELDSAGFEDFTGNDFEF